MIYCTIILPLPTVFYFKIQGCNKWVGWGASCPPHKNGKAKKWEGKKGRKRGKRRKGKGEEKKEGKKKGKEKRERERKRKGKDCMKKKMI